MLEALFRGSYVGPHYTNSCSARARDAALAITKTRLLIYIDEVFLFAITISAIFKLSKHCRWFMVIILQSRALLMITQNVLKQLFECYVINKRANTLTGSYNSVLNYRDQYSYFVLCIN